MTFVYDPLLNRTDAIARHFAAAASNPFSVGFAAEAKPSSPAVFMNQVGENFRDMIKAIAQRAHTNGIELNGFVANNFVSLTFNGQTDHDSFMRAMNAYRHEASGTFTVQVHDKSEYWNQAVQKWREAYPHIQVIETPYSVPKGVKDFTFTNLTDAQKFCEEMEHHNFDVAAEILSLKDAGVRLEQAQVIDWMPA